MADAIGDESCTPSTVSTWKEIHAQAKGRV